VGERTPARPIILSLRGRAAFSAVEEWRFSAASNVSQTGALAPAAADKK
jgi:hypothetical protein